MKKLQWTLALMLASSFAFGQNSTTSDTRSNGPAMQKQQELQDYSTRENAYGRIPSKDNTNGVQQPQAQPKHQPQAKTQEEYKAYQEAAAKPEGASAEQAADDFAQKFPTSELRVVLYQRVMSLYQNENNADKTIAAGRKVIALDPTNSAALVTVASVLANRTRESDLDRDERMTEAVKNANDALVALDNGSGIPAGTPPDKVPMYKDLVRSMAYSALGTVEFNRKNYPAAEDDLRKSVAITDVQPDPVSWLQLSLTLDRENKYQDALQAANKCVEISQGHPASEYCTQERDRLVKLAGPNAQARPAQSPTAPAASAPASTPATATPQSSTPSAPQGVSSTPKK